MKAGDSFFTKTDEITANSMNIIEKLLQEHSLNTEQSILQGQWEFDKKNIPNALKAIAVVFPHYSLHDESHSVSILNNIVKMLSEEVVNKLSCSDLWLMLEAAYCHDLGMVVTAERLDSVLQGDDFLKHFMKIYVDEDHPLHEYSKSFCVKDGKLYFNDDEFQVDKFDSSRYLLADYFRSKHAENSKKTIDHPFDEAGIDSPRTIIPARLFGVLSDICKVHTQNFDSVLELPKNEDGIGLDECHPRFIACMLRLGDLLDIDNNRFSDTLMRTIKAMPDESETHLDKHKNVTHLSINSKCIEIESICHSPKVAQVTQDWFDWISEEFKTQTLKWNSIIPDGLDCYLPTLNHLHTKIEGYETINGKKKPKFTIDTAKALELLQGKNFYNDPFDSIREIIQNGVDSTLLWIFYESDKKGVSFNSLDKGFLEIAKQYPITVTILEQKGKYTVEVSDQGMGMKRDQLTYLINTGSSSKNIEKKLMIEKMPEWMRPSGVFGIGFQSIFLLTNKVEILTKYRLNDEKMAIEMYSPNSQMKGDIYLKKVEGTCDAGMTVKFEVKNNVKMNAVQDPFNAVPKKLNRAVIESKIREYASKSVVPITIKYKAEDIEYNEPINRGPTNYYDEEIGIELYFNPETFDFNYLGGASYFYRNAKVNGNGAEIMFLSPEVNIHFGSAKDLLTLDRGSFKDGKQIAEKAREAIIDFINSEKYEAMLSGLETNIKESARFKFSFFVEYYNKGDEIRNKMLLNDVNNFILKGFGDKPLGEIVKAERLRYRTSTKQVLQMLKEDDEIIIEANILPVVTPNLIVEISKLIFKMASDNHKHCYCTERIIESIFAAAEYLFTNDDEVPEIKLTIEDVKSNLEGTTSRSFLNYLPGYEEIKIPSVVINPAIVDSMMTKPVPTSKIEKIISPFIKIDGKLYYCMNEELYKYVSDTTGKDLVSVKAAYERFLKAAKDAGINYMDPSLS